MRDTCRAPPRQERAPATCRREVAISFDPIDRPSSRRVQLLPELPFAAVGMFCEQNWKQLPGDSEVRFGGLGGGRGGHGRGP